MQDKNEVKEQIGVRIRVARERAKLTQEKLAEKLGCTNQYISDVERGVTGISIYMLRDLCMLLGITTDSILFCAESKHDLSKLEERCQGISDTQFQMLIEIINNYIDAISESD